MNNLLTYLLTYVLPNVCRRVPVCDEILALVIRELALVSCSHCASYNVTWPNQWFFLLLSMLFSVSLLESKL